MAAGSDAEDDEWPPREARVRAALWHGEGHLRRGEWAHAGRALAEVVSLAADPDVVRGMRNLAAAGVRAGKGDGVRARRQLARGRARLEPFLPAYEEVDLGAVIEVVADAVGWAGRNAPPANSREEERRP